MENNFTITELRESVKLLVRQLVLFHPQHCINQADLAKLIGVTPAQMSRLATGVSTPSALTLCRLLSLYGELPMLVKRHDYNLPDIRNTLFV